MKEKNIDKLGELLEEEEQELTQMIRHIHVRMKRRDICVACGIEKKRRETDRLKKAYLETFAIDRGGLPIEWQR